MVLGGGCRWWFRLGSTVDLSLAGFFLMMLLCVCECVSGGFSLVLDHMTVIIIQSIIFKSQK